MDREGFIDLNTKLSPKNSGKADSYARAIKIVEDVLPYQSVIKLNCKSLYDIPDIAIINEIIQLVKEEVVKMKNQQVSIFDYGNPNQRSYHLKGFYSAALRSLKQYAQYEQDVSTADSIVVGGTNFRIISTNIIAHFDITKESEDRIFMAKQRKGQDYSRRMIFANYRGSCALTGIDIPQLLLASHIIPWADSTLTQKLNPENGICLSVLYDKAFDRGFITISPDDYTVCLPSALREYETREYFDKYFGCIAGKRLIMPIEHCSNSDYLAYHRDRFFIA